MEKSVRKCIFFVIVALTLSSMAEASIFPDRRKDQFATDFGYALFPYPYSLPGIGTGLGLVGGASNIAGTHTDAYGMAFGGDITGVALGVADVHVLPKTLILDTGFGSISSATIQSYSSRGMKNTDKNDYSNIELGDMTYYGSRATATFFERRFELYGAYYQGSSQLKSIRDRDGNLIVETQSARSRGHVTLLGTRVDLTDDYADPRRGVRLDVGRSLTPPQDSGPDFYIQDMSFTGYIPLGRRSTWAFNYFHSDAHVNRQGEIDRLKVRAKYNCASITDPTKLQLCEDVVDNEVASTTYGSASSLGGFSRLRSYSSSRYSGAHTRFYGTEIRWNLTDESTPYDIFIMKDIRTAWQIALYYEVGSTADIRSELGDAWRTSTGIGLRMVTASGVVFRADVAAGSEGVSPSIFIGYPWEL
jgi:outer membrane protein assembly factor BamA